MMRFNGIHARDYMLAVKTEIPAVTVKDTYLDIPRRSGSVLIPGTVQDRIIKVTLSYERANTPDVWRHVRRIVDWLTTDEREQLIFDSEPDKYYMAKIDGTIDAERLRTTGRCTVTFRGDPYMYGYTRTVTNLNQPLYVEGTQPVPFRLEVRFTADKSNFELISGSRKIKLVKAVQNGKTLLIDTQTGAIQYNGINTLSDLDWQNSQFFKLQPGENVLSGTLSNCTFALTYNPRWI